MFESAIDSLRSGHMRLFSTLAVLVCVWATPSCPAQEVRHIYVDPGTGDDAANGLAASESGNNGPTRTIDRAVRLSRPGDIIDLAKATYFESIDLTGKFGEPGRPLVIDGHGATLNGERPIDPQTWKEVSPGLYRNTTLWEMPLRKQKDWVLRWFMIFDGKVNRMGRCMKGENAPYKNPQDLQPGEWTYQENDEHAFYIKVNPSQPLTAARVSVPWEVNGVSVHGANHDVIIRNITATRVINDGYNITPVPSEAKIHDVHFENIGAIECGDDGLSAHEDCSLFIDGFFSTRNGTGLCTTGNAVNNRLHVVNNVGWEIFFYENPLPADCTQVITNSLIDCGADNAFLVMGGRQPGVNCLVKLDNVVILAPKSGPARSRTAKIGERAHVEAKRITTDGLSFEVGGLGMDLHDGLIIGGATASITTYPNAKWAANHNVYDLLNLTLQGHEYRAGMFKDYQQSSSQDVTSTFESVDGRQLLQMRGRRMLSDKPVGADWTLIPGVDTIKPGKTDPPAN